MVVHTHGPRWRYRDSRPHLGPRPQVTAFVAASIIAPGFELLVKIPLGLVLRRGNVVRRGLVSTGAAIWC